MERIEQDRLSTVMKYHSNGLGAATSINLQHDQSTSEFPFSITSSMEKGTLNRYDNIWPYGMFITYIFIRASIDLAV